MNFFLVVSTESESRRVVGVVVESDEGVVHARLAGAEGPDDAARVVRAMLDQRGRQGFRGFPIVGRANGTRVVSYVKPGQSGFVRAWLSQLKPPLALGASGVVPAAKVAAPDLVSADVWRTFASSTEDEMPADERLL